MKLRRISSAFTTCFSESEIHEIRVEVVIKSGLQRFDIIGLPQHMIREGRDRILSALASLGVELPSQKLLVSLNPGSLPKEGSHFDLPILYAILKGIGLLPNREEREFLWGELSLDGRVSPPNHLLPSALFASRSKAVKLYANFTESEFHRFIYCRMLQIENVADLLKPDEKNLSQSFPSREDVDKETINSWLQKTVPAWDGLRASPSQLLFWCLVLLGRHHALVSGPPGIGKTSWAHAIADLQIPLPCHEWTLHSSQPLTPSTFGSRPFVAPHHSSSRTAVIGGGNSVVLPGALTRAHQGILFLDEIAEFNRDILEALREPLEQKTVTIARGCIQKTLPADCQVVATMNPCTCGYRPNMQTCSCFTQQFSAYKARVSGPIRDRFHFDVEWKYQSEARDSRFESREIKRRLLEARKRDSIDLNRVALPLRLSPRQEIRWLEGFVSWCRWNDIAAPTEIDSKRYANFISEFREGEAHEFERSRRA